MLTARLLLALCRRASPCPALSWGGCACRGIEPRLEPFTLRAVSAHASPCPAGLCHASPCPAASVGSWESNPSGDRHPYRTERFPCHAKPRPAGPCRAPPCGAPSCHEAWAFGSRTRTKTISPTAPESAHALPGLALPSPVVPGHALPCVERARGWSRTTHTTIRATSYICSPMPRPAEPCHAPQSRALTCTAQSVRAPDSNRRVCHPRYRSKEPKPYLAPPRLA